MCETNPFAEIVGDLDFDVFSENDDMGSNLFEMGLGIGLDFSVSREHDEMGQVLNYLKSVRKNLSLACLVGESKVKF